jgi:hypothetical protein
MVQKGIALDFESPFIALILPFGFQHRPDRAVSGPGRGTESSKIVCADEKLSSFLKGVAIY